MEGSMASILARNGPDQTIYADGNAKVFVTVQRE